MQKTHFIYSRKSERKDIILSNTISAIEEIESEGKEICGYLLYLFYPDEGVGTVMEWEGVLNPKHILQALESQGIIQKMKN